MYLVTVRDTNNHVCHLMINPEVSLEVHMKTFYPDYTYTYVKSGWPDPPPERLKVLRPDWTRKIGASWEMGSYIYTLVREDRISFIRPKSLDVGHMNVPGDTDLYWNTITRLPKED